MSRFTNGRVGRLVLLLIAAPLFFAACAQTRVVDEWRADKAVTNKPDKVAVIAVLPDALTRKVVERDVARILVDRGTPAVPASGIKGMSGGIRGEIDVEVATGLLRDADVDGIVVLGGTATILDNYIGTDVTGTVELQEGVEMVMPGDNTEMTATLIQPIALEEGQRFAIREGGRTVGAGVVSKIIE